MKIVKKWIKNFTLENLDDTNVTSPQDDQVLVRQGSVWVNQDPIDAIENPTPKADGDTLFYDQGADAWVAGAPPEAFSIQRFGFVLATDIVFTHDFTKSPFVQVHEGTLESVLPQRFNENLFNSAFFGVAYPYGNLQVRSPSGYSAGLGVPGMIRLEFSAPTTGELLLIGEKA